MNDLVNNGKALQERVLAKRPKTGSPVPAGPTAKQSAAMEKFNSQADVIRDAAFAATMASAVSVCKDIGASGYKVYLDRMRKDCGSPTDPVEIMLIEQLALAHHRIGQLHVQAEQAQNPDSTKVYLTAAIRLTGELRRLTLALKQYRQPIRKRQFTVVRQQNVAKGPQQVAYLDQNTASQDEIPFNSGGGQQGSKRLENVPQTTVATQSQTTGSRSAEQVIARSADTERTDAAAPIGPQKSTLEILDGTEVRGG